MIHGYIRVSTKEQAQEGRSSLEDQENRINAIATINGLPSPIIWRDAGVSGATPVSDRPDGSRMLAALSPGDTVIAAKLDRLFRNAEDALIQSRTWRSANIDLILTDMGTEPVTTSAAGRLYFGMLAQFAEFERERIAERIRDGRSAKKSRGGFIGGHPPTGYAVRGTGRDAILVETDEMRMINSARALSEWLSSPTQIAAAMNEHGYRSRANTPIKAAQVWRWLRRPKEEI